MQVSGPRSGPNSLSDAMLDTRGLCPIMPRNNLCVLEQFQCLQLPATRPVPHSGPFSAPDQEPKGSLFLPGAKTLLREG